MKIYLARNNVQAGPYTLEEVNAMLASGAVVLDDLAWHSGMSQWQRLGDLTGGQYHYNPTNQPMNTPPTHGFGDNVELRQSSPQRVSVAELYGKKTETLTPQAPLHHITANTAKEAELTYATLGSRCLALAVNLTLFIVAFLPFISSLVKLNPDQQKMTTGSLEARMAYAQTLAEQIPSQVATMTLLMLGGFFLIQFLLIVMRGQSFGKLVTGIRAVDEKTGKLPSFGALVGARTILLFVIYWLAMTLPFNLALVLVAVNYFLAAKSDKKQGWHDRLAKTIVVKAHASQLDKTKPQNNI
ncbi:MAG: RDD family protein [Moraxella sp.]|nr:RDD family protein [Moraxella sp.]